MAPLHFAVQKGSIGMVSLYLCHEQINANVKDEKEWTPLHFAAYGGFVDITKSLLNSGVVDVNCQNSDGLTPLHIAAEQSHTEIVSLLLSYPNIDPNIQDQNGILKKKINWTPLHFALYNGNMDTVKRFKAADIDINCQNSIGLSILHFAVKKGQPNLVSLILSHPNINVNICDENGIFFYI